MLGCQLGGVRSVGFRGIVDADARLGRMSLYGLSPVSIVQMTRWGTGILGGAMVAVSHQGAAGVDVLGPTGSASAMGGKRASENEWSQWPVAAALDGKLP